MRQLDSLSGWRIFFVMILLMATIAECGRIAGGALIVAGVLRIVAAILTRPQNKDKK